MNGCPGAGKSSVVATLVETHECYRALDAEKIGRGIQRLTHCKDYQTSMAWPLGVGVAALITCRGSHRAAVPMTLLAAKPRKRVRWVFNILRLPVTEVLLEADMHTLTRRVQNRKDLAEAWCLAHIPTFLSQAAKVHAPRLDTSMMSVAYAAEQVHSITQAHIQVRRS